MRQGLMSVKLWLTLWAHECLIFERYRQGQFSERGYLSVDDANKFYEQ